MESGEIEKEEIRIHVSQTLNVVHKIRSVLGARSLRELRNQGTGKLGARPD